MDNADALTEEEVAALPEGTPVTVTWSGGNGPHPYVITRRDACVYAWAKDIDHNGRLQFYNPLTFVGQERFHTRVWLRNSVGNVAHVGNHGEPKNRK